MKKMLMFIMSLFFLNVVTIAFAEDEFVNVGNVRDEINIAVTAIKAGYDSNYVDSSIKPLADEIKTLFNFSEFFKIKKYTILLKEGASDRIILPGKAELVVSYLKRSGEDLVLRVSMGDKLNTEFSLAPQGHIIIGGPKYKNGNMIFLIKAGISKKAVEL